MLRFTQIKGSGANEFFKNQLQKLSWSYFKAAIAPDPQGNGAAHFAGTTAR
jgi:hypothetical protein